MACPSFIILHSAFTCWRPKLDCRGPWRNVPIMMKANRIQLRADTGKSGSTAREAALECRLGSEAEIDVALLEDSLAKTPWERMQANDDALHFAASLRDALEKRNAKP
jgi:hypothetical protein